MMLAALRGSRKAKVGTALLGVFALLGIVGPLLAGDAAAPVAVPLEPPSLTHVLGTSGQGQDMLALTVAGARTTLAIGFGAGLLVVALGALLGTAAGYFGGLVDEALSLIINVFLIVPGLPLMVVIAAYLPAGRLTMAAALVVTGWAWSARVFRAQTLALRGTDFVAAAIVTGESAWRIITREILPNMSALLVSAFIGATVYAIAAQVGLEFLGLGDLSAVSWGTSLYWAQSESALLTGSWWTFVPAGLCLGLVGFALALVNGALDEVADPRLRAGFRPWAHSTPVRRDRG
jgi:peptide/nickel transport system permease protein